MKPRYRQFRARCSECSFDGPEWTSESVARVRAEGHVQQTGHDCRVEHISDTRGEPAR